MNAVVNFESALSLHAAGNITGAEHAYRTVIAREPRNFAAMEKLGLICLGSGRGEEASKLLGLAVALNPTNVENYLNLAVAHRSLGHLPEAILCNRKAIEMGAAIPEAYLNLGDVLAEFGEFDEAIASYKEAIKLRPNFAEAHNNIGSALINRQRPDEALSWLEKSIDFKRDYPQAHHNFGIALQSVGRHEEAITAYKTAIRLLPNTASLLNLGNALYETRYGADSQERLEQAIVCYKKTLELNPEFPQVFNNLGLVYSEQNKMADAVAAFKRVLQLNPNDAAACFNLGLAYRKQGKHDDAAASFKQALALRCDAIGAAPLVKRLSELLCDLLKLPAVYKTSEEIEQQRNAFSKTLHDALSVVAELGRPLDANERQALRGILFTITNYHLAAQQKNDKDLQVAYAKLATKILEPELSPFLQKVSPQKDNFRIRIGIASEHLSYHYGAYWVYGWVSNLSKQDYELFFYSLNGDVDAMTDRFAGLGTYRWLPFRDKTYLESLKAIREDNLDVLLIPDVGMSPANRILSLARLAPIQAVGYGHPVTTGSPNIDYFFSSDSMEPENGEEQYSEELVRNHNVGIHFEFPDDIPSSARRLDFGIPGDKALYGGVHALHKYLPEFDSVFPAIAKNVPNAFFVFVGSDSAQANAIFEERLRAAFEREQLNFEKYVRLLPRLSAANFMKLLSVLDVNLDSIGWSGANVTMRSLAMNIPVVTLPGDTMRSRHSYSMLKTIDMKELIANSLEDYISVAIQLGLDQQLRSLIVEKIKVNKTKLFKDPTCVEVIDGLLKTRMHELRWAQKLVEA